MNASPFKLVVTVYVTGPLNTTETIDVNPNPDNVSVSPGL